MIFMHARFVQRWRCAGVAQIVRRLGLYYLPVRTPGDSGRNLLDRPPGNGRMVFRARSGSFGRGLTALGMECRVHPLLIKETVLVGRT